MYLFALLKILIDGVRRKDPKHRFTIIIFTSIFFLFCFTSRLIPDPSSDRAVFVSVSEYLLSGNKLYIDIYDNKDPLFFYAVSMQRLLGPVGEYLFELVIVIIAAISAYNISRIIERTVTKRKILLLIVVPLLVTGSFWLPGYTHLPATAFSLLACSLFLSKKMLFAGGFIGLVAFTKVIMFPLPAAFCLTYEIILWDKKNSRAHFNRMFIGFTSISIITIIILLSRHELLAYLQAQQNNFLYANNVLVDNSSLLNSFASHLRTVFLGSKEKLLLLFSLIASISFSIYIATQSKVEKKIKAFLSGTFATYIISIIILGFTGSWDQHLQLMYFSQTLMLIYIAISLNSRKAFTNLSFGIAIVVLAILLSGTLNLRHYVASPNKIMTKISYLTQESPETKAFRAIYPNGTGFARLGQNSNVIPYGAANDRLLCPEFTQYPFYSPERFKKILDCAKTASTLVVDGSFVHLDDKPDWWPREAQEKIMMENWNNFVTAGENIIKTQYSCKNLETTRVCDSVAK